MQAKKKKSNERENVRSGVTMISLIENQSLKTKDIISLG